MTRRLVLASASTARLGLLRAAGFAPEAVASGVEEGGVEGLVAPAVARSLAERKADAVAARLAGDGAGRGALVLGCDSVLDVGGEVRGKPASAAQAAAWCRGYRGARGTLCTGHALVDVASGRHAIAVARTAVRFGTMTDAEIAAYVATGEPLGVAGGFTIDGYAAPFVEGIEGDHTNVLGLSLPLLRRLLAELGVGVTELWAAP